MDPYSPLVNGAEDQRFFELAATIIPVLLFGSVIANALRPPDETQRIGLLHGIRPLAFAIYLTAMASAEMLAIAVAVGGGATDGIRIFVAMALVVGICGFGLVLLVPWALRFRKEQQTPLLLGTLVAILFLGLFGWSSVFLMQFAFEGSRSSETYEEARRLSDMADRTYLEWSYAALEAHSDQRVSRLEKHQLAILRRRKSEAQEAQVEMGFSVPPVHYAR